MKTIYITEAQKKKLKKAVAAQDQVGGKVNAGVMDAVVGGMCESKNIQKWYRGFDSKFGIKSKYTPYLLWLTDDLEYAKEYGDSVMEFDIDFSKCNGSVYDLPEDIDYYDGPDRQTAKELLKQGINSYCFYANQDSSYCMCLWDKSPIVSSNIIKIDNSLFENIEDDKYELGAEKGDISPYYHVNESEEETITLYHGVNRKGLEFNFEHGGFIPRVCSEGGPKAVWLSEKQYGYEFTFAFDIPRKLVEQLSNVDYIYRNEITFDTFNCRLVKSSIYIYLDNSTSVEVNLLNDKLSKLHFRYFPDLGILLWKEFKDFPNILEKYINPYIEKYQTLSEGIENEKQMIDINQVINTPQFKAWFGNSKVVDENGKPIIVHHGSPKFEGDKFNKEKIGSSINGGESGVFCTTQDISWAKRFSYPAKQGSSSFSVKLDTSKPGDILSGFLKLEHPLDFFHLSKNDWNNIISMARDTYFGELIDRNPEKWLNDRIEAISIGNHQFVKHDISSAIKTEFGNFGEQLKRYGYDGYIALMDNNKNAVEYCFIEPNQFKSIYSLAFNPNSDSIYENKSNINTKEEKTNFGKVWYINAVDNSFRFALYKYDDDSNCLYLSNVFVEESSRRQGLGNYILNLTNDFAKKMNVKEIFLKVKKGTFMCKWYEKNGYEYFSDDETDSNYIWMVKEVAQNNIIENKKKIIKNDKGEIVPDKCDKCGGEVVLQIHGEPVYLCKDCGKYFGTMPFHLKENKLNEEWGPVQDAWEDYSCSDLLFEFLSDKQNNISKKQWNLIPAEQYHNLLRRYMENPSMARIPNIVKEWMDEIIIKNTLSITYITDLAGHSQDFPFDDCESVFDEEVVENLGYDYYKWSEYLDNIGFYDWCSLPDGSDGWSDYGLQPIYKILEKYNYDTSPEDTLILINRVLDVYHCRGDLASAFIEGGSHSCEYISNVKESIDYSKWLQQLKKRRDPYNIEENIENEDKWNGDGEKLEPLKRIKKVPPILYHASYKKNRESILKNGIFASVGDEYRDWWNYEGPNGEIPDDDELEYLVFLTTKPTTWSDNYFLDQMDIFEIDTKQLDNTCFYLDPDKYLALKGSICYTGNIPPSAIKLYNSVYRGKSVNENVELEIKPDEVDLSSFNIKKKLNPKFWIDGHLDSRIRLKLLDISDDFIEYLGIDPDIVKDVIMTGSLANFNWNEEFSDIDLHVLLDYSDVDENTEFVKQYFMSQKNLWNNEHQDLKIFGFPIEVYVQDINEKHDSSGVYSLDRDKWLKEPDRDVLASSKVNKEFIRNKVSDYVNKIDKLLYIYKKAKNDEYKLGKIAEIADKLWDEIKNSRKQGFQLSGGKEINNENVIFKYLRRNKYLDKLYLLKHKTYDRLMSIE